MSDPHKPTVLAITRHLSSQSIIKEFIEGVDIGAHFRAVVMDAIAYPDSIETALEYTEKELAKADVVIVATKIFDRAAGRNDLPELLSKMQYNMDLGDKPLILTNLNEFSATEKAEILAIHPNTIFVDHDNLGINGMKNLSDPIRKCLRL
jgi:hypothetical protein